MQTDVTCIAWKLRSDFLYRFKENGNEIASRKRDFPLFFKKALFLIAYLKFSTINSGLNEYQTEGKLLKKHFNS